MECPKCDCEDSKVINSRKHRNYVRRQRQCLSCGHRYLTREMVADDAIDMRVHAASKAERKIFDLQEFLNLSYGKRS